LLTATVILVGSNAVLVPSRRTTVSWDADASGTVPDAVGDEDETMVTGALSTRVPEDQDPCESARRKAVRRVRLP
jgi:hypothetical protein